MSIALISNIGSNRATFKNTAISGQDQGDISWTELESLGGDVYETTVTGADVEGNPISGETIEITVPNINPTKVFFAVIKILKDIVCPECIN